MPVSGFIADLLGIIHQQVACPANFLDNECTLSISKEAFGDMDCHRLFMYTAHLFLAVRSCAVVSCKNPRDFATVKTSDRIFCWGHSYFGVSACFFLFLAITSSTAVVLHPPPPYSALLYNLRTAQQALALV